MTDEEIIKAYEAIKAREEAKVAAAWKTVRQKEHQELVEKVSYLMGKQEVIEGPVEEYNSDYLYYDNYVAKFNDYLDDLPVGCIVRIAVEVIGPTE